MFENRYSDGIPTFNHRERSPRLPNRSLYSAAAASIAEHNPNEDSYLAFGNRLHSLLSTSTSQFEPKLLEDLMESHLLIDPNSLALFSILQDYSDPQILQEAVKNARGVVFLADGMGGYMGSQMAANYLTFCGLAVFGKDPNIHTPRGFRDAAIQTWSMYDDAFSVIKALNRSTYMAYRSMDTTGVVFNIINKGNEHHVIMASTGDSRVYWVTRNGTVEALTKDENTMSEIVRPFEESIMTTFGDNNYNLALFVEQSIIAMKQSPDNIELRTNLETHFQEQLSRLRENPEDSEHLDSQIALMLSELGLLQGSHNQELTLELFERVDKERQKFRGLHQVLTHAIDNVRTRDELQILDTQFQEKLQLLTPQQYQAIIRHAQNVSLTETNSLTLEQFWQRRAATRGSRGRLPTIVERKLNDDVIAVFACTDGIHDILTQEQIEAINRYCLRNPNKIINHLCQVLDYPDAIISFSTAISHLLTMAVNAPMLLPEELQTQVKLFPFRLKGDQTISGGDDATVGAVQIQPIVGYPQDLS